MSQPSSPQGGLGCAGISSTGPLQPHHCLSGCKTLTRGQEGHGEDKKDKEGTAASCSIPISRLYPIRGVAAPGGGMSPTLSQLCSRSVPRLREAPTGAPNQLCHSPIHRCPKPALPHPHPQQVPQQGLGLLPWRASTDCKYPTDQQSLSLIAD